MRRTYGILVVVVMMVVSSVLVGYNTKVQKNVKSGIYSPKVVLNLSLLRKLPIPMTNEDYAILQSHGSVTSIVVGTFTRGNRNIALIQDKNADGKVDFAAIWYVDRRRYQILPSPWKTYTQEVFKKLKEDILYGRQETVKPNNEGVGYALQLAKNSENVRKWREGYQVFKFDPDDPSRIRVEYSISNNGDRGVDIAFTANYRNLGMYRVSPIITKWVYCYNSQDPFLKEQVKDILEKIAENTKKHETVK